MSHQTAESRDLLKNVISTSILRSFLTYVTSVKICIFMPLFHPRMKSSTINVLLSFLISRPRVLLRHAREEKSQTASANT